MDTELWRYARILWDYMRIGRKPGDVDCLLILGSRDERVAEFAAEVSRCHHFAHVVVSGGLSHAQDLLATQWGAQTEADHFAEVFRNNHGVGGPILERQAINTGQNAILSYELLSATDIVPASILLVTKPYMERRALATFEAQWPDKDADLRVCSQNMTLEEYCNDEQPLELVVNIMVGDFQRIMEYPRRGFQTPQPMSGGAVAAYKHLCAAGFRQHLIKYTQLYTTMY